MTTTINLEELMSLIYKDSANQVNEIKEDIDILFKKFWVMFFGEDPLSASEEEKKNIQIIEEVHNLNRNLIIEFCGIPVANISINGILNKNMHYTLKYEVILKML